jgi:hypothetical protein
MIKKLSVNNKKDANKISSIRTLIMLEFAWDIFKLTDLELHSIVCEVDKNIMRCILYYTKINKSNKIINFPVIINRR